MIDFLLDTNILIYLINREEKYLRFIEENRESKFGISVISYIECLIGTNNESDFLSVQNLLDNLLLIDLNRGISLEVLRFLKIRKKKSLRDPKLADIIIASSALINNVPLVTNNKKDFSYFTDLEVIVP